MSRKSSIKLGRASGAAGKKQPPPTGGGCAAASGEEVDHHHHCAQDGEHHAGDPVKGLGGSPVSKDGGNSGAQKRDHHTHRQGKYIQPAADATWETAPVKAVKVMMNTLVPTAVLSS